MCEHTICPFFTARTDTIGARGYPLADELANELRVPCADDDKMTSMAVAPPSNSSAILAAKAYAMMIDIAYTVQKDSVRIMLLAGFGVVMQKLANVMQMPAIANIGGQQVTPAIAAGFLALAGSAYLLVSQAEQSALDALGGGNNAMQSFGVGGLLHGIIDDLRRHKAAAALLLAIAFVAGHRGLGAVFGALRHLLSPRQPPPAPPLWARKEFRVPAGVAAAVVLGQRAWNGAASRHRQHQARTAASQAHALGARMALLGEVVRIPLEQFVLRRRQLNRLTRLLLELGA